MNRTTYQPKHNPIKSKLSLGFLQGARIEENELGVLYSRGRLRRILKHGEGFGLEDLLAFGKTLYVIDRAPQRLSWGDFRLRSKNVRRDFPLIIELEYRVLDPKRMVEDNVQDTVAVIQARLEPLIRKEARQYSVYEYEILETALEELITAELLAGFGYELLYRDVKFDFDQDDYEDFQALMRALQVPQETEHESVLPTKEPAINFNAKFFLKYKLTDFERLPTPTLSESVKWLLRRVETDMRRVALEQTVADILNAEKTLQSAVDSRIYEDHGLEILGLQVRIDLDERARAHAEKMYGLREEYDYESRLREVEEIRQERKQHLLGSAITFYKPYIEKGEWQLLAMILAKDEKDASEVLKYLDDKQRERLEREMEVIKRKLDIQEKMLDYAIKTGDGLTEQTAEKFVEGVIKDVTGEGVKSLGGDTKSAKKDADETPDKNDQD